MSGSLRPDDAAAVLRAISSCWPPGPDFRQRVCAAVAELIRCDVVMFNRADLETGRIAFTVHPPEMRATMVACEEVMATVASDNPIVGHYLRSAGSPRAVRVTGSLEVEVWRRSATYREWLAPLGLEWTAVRMLPSVDPGLNVLSLYRGGPDDFTERDVAVVEALVPVLSLGLGGVGEQEGADARVLAPWTMVAFSPRGVITSVARQPGAEAPPVGGQLARAGLHALLDAPFGRLVDVDIDGVAYRAQPLGGAGSSFAFVRRVDGVGDVVGTLSDRQRDVLGLIAAGRTTAGIAQELGIAEGTARKHIELLIGRLGVANRAEAVDLWHRAGRPGGAIRISSY